MEKSKEIIDNEKSRELKDELLYAVIRMRKSYMLISSGMKLHIVEMLILRNVYELNEERGSVHASEILGKIHISKPALSQVLNSLEKKDLIRRKLSMNDHRKVEVRITKAGRDYLESSKEPVDDFLDKVIKKTGAKNAEKAIELMNLLVEAAEEAKSAK